MERERPRFRQGLQSAIAGVNNIKAMDVDVELNVREWEIDENLEEANAALEANADAVGEQEEMESDFDESNSDADDSGVDSKVDDWKENDEQNNEQDKDNEQDKEDNEQDEEDNEQKEEEEEEDENRALEAKEEESSTVDRLQVLAPDADDSEEAFGGEDKEHSGDASEDKNGEQVAPGNHDFPNQDLHKTEEERRWHDEWQQEEQAAKSTGGEQDNHGEEQDQWKTFDKQLEVEAVATLQQQVNLLDAILKGEPTCIPA